MAAAAPFLPYIVAGFQVVSALSQASAASSQANYNAQIADRNAGLAREQAARDAEAQQRHATQVLGAARAGFGASGVTSEGSPLDVLMNSASNAELDRQNILYKGELRAIGYSDTAALERSRAKAAEKEGLVGAASAIITGVTNSSAATAAKPRATTGYQLGDYSYNTANYG